MGLKKERKEVISLSFFLLTFYFIPPNIVLLQGEGL